MTTTLRLNATQDKMLTGIAASCGASKEQVVDRLIREEWERSEARRFAHRELDRIFATRAELMERLKDA
ncbi:hypothetical protein JKI95_07810 [Corynebacterium aquatimens]|uniref:hypothetical protein n=1 Tax=Corynebacterium TaxID=1716 RepID=UPI001F1CCE87|nr:MULTISPECIES: hypothetical protein [Corynebacterium]QYH19141.1 hypothetical protein JKI95_07810 [Corynebacterium aquatimens]UIZ91989.1 hypothetical protein JZY91_09960 [Corynebacterium sp. CNCTC7651]